MYLLILASFTAMPMKKDSSRGAATGSSRQRTVQVMMINRNLDF